MKTTFRDIWEFEKYANAYLESIKSDDEKKKSKLAVSIIDILEQIEPIKPVYIKKVTRIRRTNALEDSLGGIVKDEKGDYRFSKKGEEDTEDQIEILHSTMDDFDIEPAFIENIPDDLHKIVIRKFTGFVIRESK